MRKTIKDNERTYKLVRTWFGIACPKCAFLHGPCIDRGCTYRHYFSETLLSKLSRFVKRMVRK